MTGPSKFAPWCLAFPYFRWVVEAHQVIMVNTGYSGFCSTNAILIRVRWIWVIGYALSGLKRDDQFGTKDLLG